MEAAAEILVERDVANESEVERSDQIAMYQLMEELGEGAYGQVFKAKHRVSGEVFALKKVKYLINGKVPISVTREMDVLESIKHENIVEMTEFGTTHGGSYAYFILEYCAFDLNELLKCYSMKFSQAEIKGMLQQFFTGLSYLHEQQVIHRDIKPPNILFNKKGELKIADFGLACYVEPESAEDIPMVVTLWYRSAELLMGQKGYNGPAVDMWAAGCLMAEMWTREPIIQGKNMPDQLNRIIKLCGSINTDTFPEVESISLFHMLKYRLPQNRRRVTEWLKVCVKDENALDLIEKLLAINPAARVDANTALGHDFFQHQPPPCDLKDMVSRFTESKAFKSKKPKTRRKEKSQIHPQAMNQ